MGSMSPLMVVEAEPPRHTSLGLRAGFPSVQVDAFILQRPPQALDEDVVDEEGHRLMFRHEGECRRRCRKWRGPQSGNQHGKGPR